MDTVITFLDRRLKRARVDVDREARAMNVLCKAGAVTEPLSRGYHRAIGRHDEARRALNAAVRAVRANELIS